MSKPKITIELKESDSICHVESDGPVKCQFAFQLPGSSEWFCQFFGVPLRKNPDGKFSRDAACIEAEKRFLRSLPTILELKAEQVTSVTIGSGGSNGEKK